MAIKLTYQWEGDYLIPDLTPPPEPKIGVWGRRRKRYLQQHREPIYTGMLLSGSLNAHLEEIDKQAEKMLDLLIGANGAKGRRHRKAKVRKSTGMGQENEQHTNQSGGDRESRTDLRIIWKKGAGGLLLLHSCSHE